MNKILSTFAFALLLTGSAFAQSADFDASATVVADLTINNLEDLSFGLIPTNWTAGNEPTVNTDGTFAGTFQSNATAGLARIGISGSGGLTVDVTAPSSLLLSDGTDNITLTPYYAVSTDNSNAAAVSGAPVTTSTLATLTLDGDGENTIIIGGELGVPGAALNPGLYTVTETISVSYQ